MSAERQPSSSDLRLALVLMTLGLVLVAFFDAAVWELLIGALRRHAGTEEVVGWILTTLLFVALTAILLEAFVKTALTLFLKREFTRLFSTWSAVMGLLLVAALMSFAIVVSVVEGNWALVGLCLGILAVPVFLGIEMRGTRRLPPANAEWSVPQPAGANVYGPNTVRLSSRVSRSLLALALVIYGTHGLLSDDLFIPGRGGGAHLQGLAAQVMFAAIVVASSALLAHVVDHYDRRDNERWYIAFARYASLLGWVLFGIAIVVSVLGA